MKWKVMFEPKITISDFWIELLNIETYRNFVQGIPLPPTMRKEIDELNIIRTIRGTTGIEGNALSEEKIEEIITRDTSSEKLSTEEQEVVNANEVLKFISSSTPQANAIMNEDLIMKIHELTTQKCNYEKNIPGKYRNHNVTAGDYFCPDNKEIPRLMREFIVFINSGSIIDHHPVIRAILAHFYLVSIHPFGDGNGRTSRGVEAYILYNGGYYNALGFYSLANFYYRNRGSYVSELQKARFKYNGSLTEFVRFSLKGFAEELEDIKERVLSFYRRISFCDYINELLRKGVINRRIFSILRDFIYNEKSFNVRDFKDRSIPIVAALYEKRSDRTLLRDFKTMRELELIKTEGGTVTVNTSLMDAFTPVNAI